MKKSSLRQLIIIIHVVCILLVSLCSCSSSEMISYYSHKEHYISVIGTVSYINYSEDTTALYIGFSEMYPTLDDTCFKICGENFEIVKANKIDDKLTIGEQIIFITAPMYFGDGYIMPIVALSINGEDLLNFEEGYENWIDWLSK